MIKKVIVFLCLLFFINPVIAVVDYSFWNTHYISGNSVVAGEPPYGIINLYTDSPEITVTFNDLVEEFYQQEGTENLSIWGNAMAYVRTALVDSSDSGVYRYGPQSENPIFKISGAGFFPVDPIRPQKPFSVADDGRFIQPVIYTGTSSNYQEHLVGTAYLYHHIDEPLVSNFDYTPSNPTLDDELSFISFSTPINKIDKYFWSINDASTGYLYAIAANVDTFKFKPENIGNYNVTLTVTNTTTSITNTISKTIIVTSGVEVINRVNIKDASTQSLISAAELQIFNHNNDVWINSSYLYTGSTIFPANQSDVVDIYAQAENFFPAEKLGYIIPKTGGIISLLLSPDAPASNESLNRIQIIVKEDDTSNPISNVKLTVNQGDNSIVKYTNNDGYAVFELDPELIANILAEKSGYYDLSKRLDISSPSSVDELRLTKITVAPTPTYTLPTPTLPPGQTGGGYNPDTGEYEPYYDPDTGVYVTPTFVGGWENPEFEENVCIKAPYPNNWGYMDILQNGIACNGVKGAVNQKLVLSLIIITLIALVLSRYAKGTGALAGGIVGSLVCMGMGLLPIWIAILMIVICGIVIAKMIIGGAK